ncbi:hypothetical protein IWZ01DRAFT_313076 [Phyllosticta capitalensis]
MLIKQVVAAFLSCLRHFLILQGPTPSAWIVALGKDAPDNVSTLRNLPARVSTSQFAQQAHNRRRGRVSMKPATPVTSNPCAARLSNGRRSFPSRASMACAAWLMEAVVESSSFTCRETSCRNVECPP